MVKVGSGLRPALPIYARGVKARIVGGDGGPEALRQPDGSLRACLIMARLFE